MYQKWLQIDDRRAVFPPLYSLIEVVEFREGDSDRLRIIARSATGGRDVTLWEAAAASGRWVGLKHEYIDSSEQMAVLRVKAVAELARFRSLFEFGPTVVGPMW